jgi:hypothetical protein
LLWRPLFWVFALVAAGTAGLHLGGVPGMLAHTGPAVTYSLGTLLPIVQLENPSKT